MPPLAGEVILGASLHIGYFAQAHEGLDPERTLVEEIDTVAPQSASRRSARLLSPLPIYRGRSFQKGQRAFRRGARPPGAGQAFADPGKFTFVG